MSLREPVEVPLLADLGPTHFIAVGGVGMSGIARLFAESGLTVSGSDAVDSPTLASLRAAGVSTFVGHQAEQLGAARTVVVSSAIRESNPELAAARARGLRVLHRSAALAALMAGHRTKVAVSGTHGKTTTTAMIAQVLTGCGADPSYVIGGVLAGTAGGARLGGGSVIVVEADESDGSFLQYPCDLSVVTNVEADHLDNWGTPAAYAEGFVRFVRRTPCAAICLDDPGARTLAATVGADGATEVVGYGSGPDAAVTVGETSETARGSRTPVTIGSWHGTLTLRQPGRHSVLDAAAALTVGHRLGCSPDDALAALAQFGGTARRFEQIADVDGVVIIDDYAHHPTELATNVAAARRRVGPGGHLIVCFQPHLFSRTREFAAEFGRALGGADIAVVLDVYPAREDPLPGVSGRLVADAVPSPTTVHYVETLDAAAPLLADLAGPGDLVLTAGAGNVTTVGPALARLLTGRAVEGRPDGEPVDGEPADDEQTGAE